MNRNLFKELAGAGLVKGTHVEQFDGKDEVTTSGDIATTVTPFKDDKEGEDQTERFDQEESQFNMEEACGTIETAMKGLAELYEKMSGGKKLGELFCPNCTKDDMRPAFDSDQNQSVSNNVTNAEKGQGY